MSVVFAFACLATAGVARAADDAAARILSVSPTVFFVKEKDSLWQQAELVVENGAAEQELTIDIKAGSAQRSLSLGKVKPGKTTHAILVPDVPAPTSVTCTLKAADKVLDSQAIDWRPGRHWRIFYVPITHHDLGYTDTIENVLEQYDGFYDNVVRFCEETEDWPEESRYHYTAEGAWSLQHYVRNRPEAALAKLRKYVGQGRIEIPALYGNEISGLCGHEELVRLMYPSFQLKRQLGGEIRTGSITDIPGVSWGLPTVLSGVGVKYFFAGFPTYFQWSGQNVHEFWDASAVLRHGRPDAFRWEGPDGGSVLLYYQGSYGMLAGGVGPNSYKEIFDDLPATLEDMQQRGSPFDVARFIHNGVDNYPPDVRISHVAREWNDRWAYPRLIVATNTMFFEALEKQCGDVRVFRGEVPHTDYAVGATSTAKETCINRGTHDRLPTAEKFATMAWLLADYPRPPAEGKWVRELSSYDDPTRKLGDAYDNMLLYDEHTWGMAHPAGVRQDWSWSDKSRYAYRAAGLASSILDGSVHALADRVRLKEDGRHIVVFNPLSLARSDVVRVSGEFGEEPFELVDVETGAKVPGQFVRLDNPLAPLPYAADRHGRGQFSPAELFDFVFVAENVPPMGWKTYRFMPVKEAAPVAAPVQVGDGTLENRFFKVTLDPRRGTIRSIIDKELQRELVDQDAPHQLNQLIVRHVADGKLESPVEARIEKGPSGLVFSSLTATGAAFGCPQLVQEITLYDRIKRIDLANRVLKDSTPTVEAYFAFPFKMDKPEFHFEASNSVIKPLRDQLPGSNSNYYSVQHWADVADGKLGVTLTGVDSHLMEFGGLWPCYVSQAHHGVTAPDFGRPFATAEDMAKGHVYAFVLDSNFRTNFPTVQQSDLLFRYSIGVHPGDWRTGYPRDFGWAACNPLVPVVIGGTREGPLEPRGSFCEVAEPNVLVLTLKRAEDGRGVILRLIETEGKAATATVRLPLVNVKKATQTNLAEEDQAELPSEPHGVRVPIKPFGIATVRLETK
jgi:hypothetical protein